MHGTAPRRRSIGTRLAVVAGMGAAVLLTAPGTAVAADPVTPLVSCVTPVQDGWWTAVFGYRNATSTTQRQPIGGDNDFDPDRFNGPQAETFEPGTHHGVFTVRVPSSYSSIQWGLYDSRVSAYRTGSTACPAAIALPADGNGLGPLIASMAAGLVAAGLLYGSRRRQRRAAQETPAPSMG